MDNETMNVYEEMSNMMYDIECMEIEIVKLNENKKELEEEIRVLRETLRKVVENENSLSCSMMSQMQID